MDLHFENCLLKKSKSWNPWSQEGWAVFCAVLSVTDCFPPFQSTTAWWQSLRNAGNQQKTRAGHSGCQTEQSLAMSESARHTSDKIMLEHQESIPWPLILFLLPCLGTWAHLIGGVHSPVVKICCQICRVMEATSFLGRSVPVPITGHCPGVHVGKGKKNWSQLETRAFM